MPKLLKPGELASLLRPGMKVFIQSASGEPRTLIQELLAEQEACSGIEFLSCQIPGLNRYNFAGLHRRGNNDRPFCNAADECILRGWKGSLHAARL